MLVAAIYTYRASTTEESSKRLNILFRNWKPPKGYEIKSHYAFADCTGGVSLVEAASAEAVYEAIVRWIPFVEFRIVPVVEIEKAFPLATAAIAWRESVRN